MLFFVHTITTSVNKTYTIVVTTVNENMFVPELVQGQLLSDGDLKW